MPCINGSLLLLGTLWKLREGPNIFAKIRIVRYANLIVQIAKVTHTQNVLVHKNSERGMSQKKYTACTSACMSKEPDVLLPSPPPFPPPFPPSRDKNHLQFGMCGVLESFFTIKVITIHHYQTLCHIAGSMQLNRVHNHTHFAFDSKLYFRQQV